MRNINSGIKYEFNFGLERSDSKQGNEITADIVKVNAVYPVS